MHPPSRQPEGAPARGGVKTLVLCFIHGFKGGESTFGPDDGFARQLTEALGRSLPRLRVLMLVYPKYETRGQLGRSVGQLRDWLEEKVIDLEVAAGTASPTVEPSVRTVLVGHSMGGIVAAEVAIALASDRPILPSEDEGSPKAQQQQQQQQQQQDDDGPAFNRLMFPYIQGLLAIDTPFLGIAPSVVAHGAEDHYQKAAATVSQFRGLHSALVGPAAGAGRELARVPSSPSPWAPWGKVAVYAGAVAAGSAAAWVSREHLSSGWSWLSSHLQFVGCLTRADELESRLRRLLALRRQLGFGFANLYTRLDRAASPRPAGITGALLGTDRTFCSLPGETSAGVWLEAVNGKAADEVQAHTTMFEPEQNPGYEKLVQDAVRLISDWLHQDAWYDDGDGDDDAGDAPEEHQGKQDSAD